MTGSTTAVTEPVRMTLTERRAQELRLHIAQTAAELFVREGTTSVTVERIAEAAGVHPRTFHRHFPVKEDVVVPLFALSTGQLVDALEHATDTGDPVETLVAAWTPVVEGGAGDEFGRALMRLVVQDPEYRFRWLQMDDRLVAAVSDFLDRSSLGLVDDELRTLPAALLVQAVRHVFERWVADGATGDVLVVLRRAVRVVLHGVRPAPHEPADLP